MARFLARGLCSFAEPREFGDGGSQIHICHISSTARSVGWLRPEPRRRLSGLPEPPSPPRHPRLGRRYLYRRHAASLPVRQQPGERSCTRRRSASLSSSRRRRSRIVSSRSTASTWYWSRSAITWASGGPAPLPVSDRLIGPAAPPVSG